MKGIPFLRFAAVLPVWIIWVQSQAQKWVDTLYQIHVERELVYGESIDFSGNERQLMLDVAFPVDDSIPVCGRPMIAIIHGGAFMSGSRNDYDVQRLMKDFARRGYVAFAPDYRLGMFNTERNHTCLFSALFQVEWNCLNVQDSSEWYRAWYRAVCDVKGALRYMTLEADRYSIDPLNAFVAGFSAGGFISLGVAYLDDSTERLNLFEAMPDAIRPNILFEDACIRKYHWHNSINLMNLARPSLGPIEGTLNPYAPNYRLRGAGNLFGALFYNLFQSNAPGELPALYTFHQPNDLIVPYDPGRRVFDGYSACLYGLCQKGVINRPTVLSSLWIRNTAQRYRDQGLPAPLVLFDSTTNYTDCSGQIANPSQNGHQLDDYWLRTRRMATFFAGQIAQNPCTVSIGSQKSPEIRTYPNPADASLHITSSQPIHCIRLLSSTGHVVLKQVLSDCRAVLNTDQVAPGIYQLEMNHFNGIITRRKISLM